ncbi:MAG: hypothetical protein AAFW68_00190 [Pseudomonadota bacterium]
MLRVFSGLIALSFAAALQPAPAQAAPDEVAFALFVAGDYRAAAQNAADAGGAENLALAARALNAEAYLMADDGDARKLAKDALEFAEDAIEADAMLVEGHLQAAISLAQRGARMAALRAFFLGIAGRAREKLDEALAREPENAWALSSSGAWHLEVARRVGEGRFGSDPALGHSQFLAARANDPENLLIAYECALRLIAYGNPEWRADGLAALETVLTGEAKDAFELAIQERAQAFSDALAAGPEAAERFIEAQP